MPIEPFHPNRPLLSPSESFAHFTNRVTEQAALDRLLKISPGFPLPLLHFYGIGGNGKSWLLRKLRENVHAKQLPNAYIDLESFTSGPLAAVTALATIREQLSVFDMPRFDLALGWYFQKIGYAREKPSRFGSKSGGLATDVIEVATGIPMLGKGLKWLGSQLEGSRIMAFIDDLTGQEFYNQLKSMTEHQIRPELGRLFLEDLALAPCPHSIPDDRRVYKPRAVLFIDTLESLRTGPGRNLDGIHDRERWIYELHNPEAPLLIVTAGRDRIRWGDEEAGYLDRRHLEQHLIGGLSNIDARDFLKKCGIVDEPLVLSILAASADIHTDSDDHRECYHSFKLGLCADTVDNARRAGKPIDPATFDIEPGQINELAKRFLKSLNSNGHELWIRSLALTPRFDEAAARWAFCESRSAEQDAAWESLRRYSFLRPTDDAGWWTFHSEMVEALQRTENEASNQHQRWDDYWRSRSSKVSDAFAGLSWFHRYRIEANVGLQEWDALAEKLRAELRMSEHLGILEWWGPVRLSDNVNAESATALNSLGVAYWQTTLGDRGANLAKAIACYEAALTIFTKERFPQDWAAIKNNLGLAYSDLPTGDRGENLSKAIAGYEAALTVRTKEKFPQQWAINQNNLAVAYQSLPTGDRGANLAKAIACFEAALTVSTKEQFPQDWAMTQNNLGLAYSNLPTGDRGANLAKAIARFEAANTVYTKEQFPQQWAKTQNNLAIAFSYLPTGDRGANLAKAIACYEAANTVYTKEQFPQDWAATQNNLGLANSDLTMGDRGANLAKAIVCYEAALTVRTKEQFPQDWAMTQGNLALIYKDLAEMGDSEINRRKAIQYVRNAIEGFRSCGDHHNLEKHEGWLKQWLNDWDMQ